jgi:GH25 family lysozyme M1 (1,4-beta-N-acetylmuramidase)
MQPLVIDIFHLNPVTDFAAVVNSGIVGVIHKAYEAGVTDKLYAVRRKAFADAGLKCWGAYCFFHGSDKGGNPKTEADRFLDAAQPDANTLIALDWEKDEDGYVPSLADAKAFLSQIQYRLGRKAVVYSGNVAKEKILGQDAYMGSHRLWLAQYGSKWNVQKSWTTPWLWQNNGDNVGPGPHNIPGLTGLVDNNTVVPPMTAGNLISQWAS